MYCQNCGKQTEDNGGFCGHCGNPIMPPKQPQQTGNKAFPWIIISCALTAAVVILAVCFVIYTATGSFLGIGGKTAVEQSATEGTATEATQAESMPYEQYLTEYPTYILSDSDSSYKCWTDVENLSEEALFLALQEIYARHGAAFDDPALQAYFAARSWYSQSSQEYALNDYEAANVTLLETQIAIRKGTLDTANNPYLKYTEDYLLSESGSRLLTEGELLNLPKSKLTAARNEIFARHGYIFSSEELRVYFYTKAWYVPSVQGDDFDSGTLSKQEHQNITLLKSLETVADENGCVVGTVTAYDQYNYSTGRWNCYHVPGVSGPQNAEKLNEKIYNECYKALQQQVMDSPDYPYMVRMHYSLQQKQHVVSLVIFFCSDYDMHSYSVYNFSAVTGRELSDAEVYSVFGLTLEQGRQKMKAGATYMLGDQLENAPAELVAAVQEIRTRTLSDENLNKMRPFINTNGQLCFTGDIYSLAGAECYAHCFTESGNYVWPSCPTHG